MSDRCVNGTILNLRILLLHPHTLTACYPDCLLLDVHRQLYPPSLWDAQPDLTALIAVQVAITKHHLYTDGVFAGRKGVTVPIAPTTQVSTLNRGFYMGAHVNAHAIQERASQRGKGTTITRIASSGADRTLPTPQPSSVVRVNQLQILQVPFPTVWTLWPMRPTHLDQHLPQLVLVHVVDPPVRLSQLCQRIRFVGRLSDRQWLLLPIPFCPTTESPGRSAPSPAQPALGWRSQV
jgi:hypothetical protein